MNMSTWLIPALALTLVFAVLWRDIEEETYTQAQQKILIDMTAEVIKFADEMRQIHSYMAELPIDERQIAHTEHLHNTAKIIEEVRSLQSRIVGKTPEGWHRKDMDEWCNDFNKINNGVKCPDPRSLPSYIKRINNASNTKR